MGKFICKICGKEFDRVGNAVYCNGPHFRPCPVCGRPVEFHRLGDPVVCCSKECVQKLAEQSKSKKQKRCEECGKLFNPVQASQKYCKGPHTSVCVVCGKEFSYTVSPHEKPKTCSRKCQEVLRSQTAQFKYGVKNVSELDFVRKKISEKNSSEDVKRKRAKTCLEHWGVDNPSKNEDIREKMSKAMSSDEYKEKRAATCIERYGFSSPMQSQEVRDKYNKTYRLHYGEAGRRFTSKEYKRRMLDPSKVDNYIRFKEDPRSFILSTYEEKPSILQLRNDLGVTDTPIYDILVANNCSDLISRRYSSMEEEVFAFLTSLGVERILRNDRSTVQHMELDFYLPDYHFAIECNPTATHNSSFRDPWGGEPKPYKYHQMKSLKCQEKGIFLFHIFGYEWNSKKEIIQSMICNALSHSKEKIYARNTYICSVSSSESCKFLNENHRQGKVNASIHLGLRLKGSDELVSVMTFGRVRKTMGCTKEDSDVWELSRFCSKLGCNVVGGASKLFKYFVSNYKFDSLISFSDVAHTRGTVYEMLGFKKKHLTDPGYVWVYKDDVKYYHRTAARKENLQFLFKDDTIDTEHFSEREIMEDHGFAQVFDSGVIRWEYT